ncbi:MAG: DUF1446 domain-containing protein [Bacteroidales bacterium]|nr:DUF1446 domain-containing protein [Bacteroidales bacterium]
MRQVRIGNGCGFWGDNIDAPIRLVQTGRLDYLTLEYLAELTMSILAIQKQRHPEAGYARDFPAIVERLVPELIAQPHLRIVTNAGGMNPRGCGEQVRQVLLQHGLADRTVAVVSGDDLIPRLDELIAAGHTFRHLDTEASLETIRGRVVSANAYLGSQPIAEALRLGASIVITGRVADAALTLGPLAHEFGWSWGESDVDRLAAGTIAGHLIECGAQVTGGIWTHAEDAPHLAQVGYPIVAVQEDGRFTITKPEGSGGCVNLETVAEQLLYEVEDPARYLTPDVVADFTTPTLHQTGPDAVEVRGCRGTPATDSYKVSIAYRDGWASAGMLVIAGPGAVEKARASGAMLLDRLRDAGYEYAHSLVEVLGAGDVVPGVLPRATPPEVVLRVAVRDPRQAAVERFTREFAPLVTSGYPGTTGYTTGRPPVREVFAYWPALVAKSAVVPRVERV